MAEPYLPWKDELRLVLTKLDSIAPACNFEATAMAKLRERIEARVANPRKTDRETALHNLKKECTYLLKLGQLGHLSEELIGLQKLIGFIGYRSGLKKTV